MRSGVAVALAAASLTQAFLLPPAVSKADVAAAEAVAEKFAPVTTVGHAGTERQKLYIDCPGCPVPVVGKDGKVQSMVVKPNHLEMALSVEHKDGRPDILVLNGIEVYPNLDPARATLIAAQFVDEETKTEEEKKPEEKEEEKKDDDDDEKKKHKSENEDLRRHVKPALKSHHRGRKYHPKEIIFPQRLGFGLSVQPPIVASDNSQLELIKIDLQVIEVGPAMAVDEQSSGVGPVFIDGIPNVHIELVKSAETGRLMIAKLEATASQTTKPDATADKDGEVSKIPADFDSCSSELCRFLVTLRAKMQAMAKTSLAKAKGHCSHHHKGKPATPGVDAASSSAPTSHHGGHHAIPHHNGGHEQHWGHALGAAAHILLPILVGILAGVSVSLSCVVIATLFIGLYRLARGRTVCSRGQCCRGGAARLRAAQMEAAAEDEKVGLMEYEYLPPLYEDDVETPTTDNQKTNV